MIDTTTGKAVTVNFAPLDLEPILRSRRRDRSMLVGYLLESLVLAAQRLWPEFEPRERRKLEPSPIQPADEPAKPWRPPWMRRRAGDGGQGLVEYALILALVAVIAIVALLFLGEQVATMFSRIGNSI
jgi:pilus assembly protein Flp/PilA